MVVPFCSTLKKTESAGDETALEDVNSETFCNKTISSNVAETGVELGITLIKRTKILSLVGGGFTNNGFSSGQPVNVSKQQSIPI